MERGRILPVGCVKLPFKCIACNRVEGIVRGTRARLFEACRGTCEPRREGRGKAFVAYLPSVFHLRHLVSGTESPIFQQRLFNAVVEEKDSKGRP